MKELNLGLHAIIPTKVVLNKVEMLLLRMQLFRYKTSDQINVNTLINK